jgi:hypothetical protein
MEGSMRINAEQTLHRIRSLKLPSPPALALYLATLLTELPVIFTRMLIALVAAVIIALLAGGRHGNLNAYSNLGLIPTVWALIALISPAGGGWWFKQNVGGRCDVSGHPGQMCRDILDSSGALERLIWATGIERQLAQEFAV